MMVELIADFFAEYPATAGSDKVDTHEADDVIDAIALAAVLFGQVCRPSPAHRRGSKASRRRVSLDGQAVRAPQTDQLHQSGRPAKISGVFAIASP
jgi:hypothetical protein